MKLEKWRCHTSRGDQSLPASGVPCRPEDGGVTPQSRRAAPRQLPFQGRQNQTRRRRTISSLSAFQFSLLSRALVGIGAPALIVLVCRRLLRGGGLVCLFYELTGLYCPGCGAGRAAIALLHGHIREALGHNPLLFLLGVPCGVLLAREYLRFVFPGLGLRKAVLPAWAGDAALGLILAFWLLRNLPGVTFLGP